MSEGRVDIIEGPDSGNRSIWEDVLAIKLNGVGFHTTMYSLCLGGRLDKMAKFHKERAIDENKEFLVAVEKFVEMFKSQPRLYMTSPALPEHLDSEDQAMSLYEEWECNTLKKLIDCRSSLVKDGKQYLSEMIKDVVDEIAYICSIKY